MHVPEPLTLYRATELYELMASIAEAWKNSGKAAWKKRINKIRENARVRKPPRNKLDPEEIKEIQMLTERIHARVEWENQEKAKIAARKKQERLKKRQNDSSSSSTSSSPAAATTSSSSQAAPGTV